MKIDESLSYGVSNNRSYEDISSVVENEQVNSENKEFNLNNEQDNMPVDEEQIIEKNIENNINHENLEEEKKPGFFRMLSNLVTSNKKTSEVSAKIPEKKQKSNKTKTDPNLFLFNDVLEEESDKANKNINSDEISEVSDISEFSDQNENIDDIDTPSYLRKGSNQ